MKTNNSLPPADPRLAFWGIILVALGIWIAINQYNTGTHKMLPIRSGGGIHTNIH